MNSLPHPFAAYRRLRFLFVAAIDLNLNRGEIFLGRDFWVTVAFVTAVRPLRGFSRQAIAAGYKPKIQLFDKRRSLCLSLGELVRYLFRGAAARTRGYDATE